MAQLHELAGELNRQPDKTSAEAANLAASLRGLGAVLGLLQAEPEAFLQSTIGNAAEGLSDAEIEQQIQLRIEAKTNKDYAQADQIRDALAAAGILLEDGAGGTTWRRE